MRGSLALSGEEEVLINRSFLLGVFCTRESIHEHADSSAARQTFWNILRSYSQGAWLRAFSSLYFRRGIHALLDIMSPQKSLAIYLPVPCIIGVATIGLSAMFPQQQRGMHLGRPNRCPCLRAFYLAPSATTLRMFQLPADIRNIYRYNVYIDIRKWSLKSFHDNQRQLPPRPAVSRPAAAESIAGDLLMRTWF